MSLRLQYNFITKYKVFWFTVMLLVFTWFANNLNPINDLNSPFYYAYNAVVSSQNTQVSLVLSYDLNAESKKLVDIIKQSNPAAIVVLSEPEITLYKNGFEYDRAEHLLCLHNIYDFMGSDIWVKKDQYCDNIWDIIVPNKSFKKSFLINFELELHALPKFSSYRILSNDILPSQIENRIIFLAQHPAKQSTYIRSPKLGKNKNSTFLHAYIADNIIKGKQISLLPDWQISVSLCVFVILLLFLYQSQTLYYNIVTLIMVILFILISFTGILSTFKLFIPVGTFTFFAVLTLFWVLLSKSWNDEQQLYEITHALQQKMIDRYLPKAFNDSDNPWHFITEFVNQHLDLHRAIFLARLEGDHRLFEIGAINCELSDINEMRRDYERPPYSDAFHQLGVTQIQRPFFKNITPQEIQFIVPLLYAGDVRGFWVMTIEPNKSFNQKAFEKNVNSFSQQIGELLFHYKITKSLKMTKMQPLARFFTFTLRPALTQSIKTSFLEAEQKLTALENVFNEARSASAFFNLFGQIITINKEFERIAKYHELPIFDMNAFELLTHITNFNHEEAKGKLRYLTLNKESYTASVTLAESVFILEVKTIKSVELHNSSGDPFEVSGILFELIDIGSITNMIDNPQSFICELESYLVDKNTDRPT